MAAVHPALNPHRHGLSHASGQPLTERTNDVERVRALPAVVDYVLPSPYLSISESPENVGSRYLTYNKDTSYTETLINEGRFRELSAFLENATPALTEKKWRGFSHPKFGSVAQIAHIIQELEKRHSAIAKANNGYVSFDDRAGSYTVFYQLNNFRIFCDQNLLPKSIPFKDLFKKPEPCLMADIIETFETEALFRRVFTHPLQKLVGCKLDFDQRHQLMNAWKRRETCVSEEPVPPTPVATRPDTGRAPNNYFNPNAMVSSDTGGYETRFAHQHHRRR